jgi:O-antigen/teichoic acid export membrane protein
MGVRGVIAAEILGASVAAVMAVRSIMRKLSFPGVDAHTLRTLVRSTITFNIYPLIANVYDRADVVLLAKLAGNFAVGIYSLPYRAFAMLLIVPAGAMGALLPVFSSAAKGDAQELCSRIMRFLFLTALLVVLATLTFAGPAALFFLGQGYAQSIITIKILVWAGIPAFLNYALNILLLSAHKEKVFLWTATACTVFNITANLLLIPRFSFLAAAAVTVATECLLLLQNLYLVRKCLGRLVFPKDGLKISVVFAGVLAGFWLTQQAVPQLWAGSLACAVFAIFAAAALPGLGRLRLASRA